MKKSFQVLNPCGKGMKGQSVNRSRELVLAEKPSADNSTGWEASKSIFGVRQFILSLSLKKVETTSVE